MNYYDFFSESPSKTLEVPKIEPIKKSREKPLKPLKPPVVEPVVEPVVVQSSSKPKRTRRSKKTTPARNQNESATNIEKIEEGFLRKILRTQKGCPISQLYLETGQWPARFQITKLRLLFLKSILDENEQSLVFKFFKLQLQQPTKNDWVSTCK